MSREEIRMKLWADVVISLITSGARHDSSDRVSAADFAVKRFDLQFPELKQDREKND